MSASDRFQLKDSVAVVTGAAGGIGGATALSLARRGCHLALTDRHAEPLAQTAQRARTLGVKVSEHVFDIADAKAITALPDQVLAVHKRVNVVINCAGVALGGLFSQVSEEEFAWLFEINFWGILRMSRVFLPVLANQPQAQLVNISSVFGLVGLPGQSAYAASKFAVRGFSEVLRHELEFTGSNIGVTVVHPGGVRTGIARNARVAAAVPAADVARMQVVWEKLLRTPPEEIGEAIAQGIERREKRILCGADAHRIDRIQRLLPVGYWNIFRKKVLPKGQ